MAQVRENEIGRCRCPVCSSTRAHLRFSGKQLAYITCNACNVQVFARGERSDAAMRAMHVPDEPEAPAPAPALPAPAAQRPALQAPPADVSQRAAWGVLSW